MAANFPGSILYGDANVPIFGRQGRPLYSSRLASASARITIDWGDDDVDICAYWVGHGGNVGYGHTQGGVTEADGYVQYWPSDDNTSGGPEVVAAGVRGTNFTDGATWRCHLNWYKGGPGTATVTVDPPSGPRQSVTSNVGNRRRENADTQDPYVEIVFNADNTVKSITLHQQ